MMRKNKHEKLAEYMKRLIIEIDFFTYSNFKKVFSFEDSTIQKLEPHAIDIHHYLLNSPFKDTVFTCLKGLEILKPEANLKRELLKIYFLSSFLQPIFKGKKDFKKLHTQNLHQRNEILNKTLIYPFYEALLHCSNFGEETNCYDWFEEENESIRTKNRWEAINRNDKQYVKLQANLTRNAFSYFKNFYDNLLKCNKKKNLKSIETVLEAGIFPKEDDSICIAYKKVLTNKNLNISKNTYKVLNLWKAELEKVIKNDLKWDLLISDKIPILIADILFGKPINTKNCISKKSDFAIDRITASKIIFYFADNFIRNPKEKHLGEIACILWIIIWATYKQRGYKERGININNILNLRIQQVDLNQSLIVLKGKEENKKIEISQGLCGMLFKLMGDNKGGKNRKLFSYVEDEKVLRDEVKKASKHLFPNQQLVTPEAFLQFLHPFVGIRASHSTISDMLFFNQMNHSYRVKRIIENLV